MGRKARTAAAAAPETIGERVLRLRRTAGLSRVQLAAECEPFLDPGTIYRLETGRANPSLTTLKAIAVGLGVTVHHILGDSDRAA